MPLPSRVTLVLCALLGAGCSAPVVDDITDASGGMTEGIVLVERVVSGDGTQTNVSAKFMRLSAGADLDLAERIVGSRLELPAVGQCIPVSPVDVAQRSARLTSLGPIDLIDVGDVTVNIRAEARGEPTSSMPLAARAFPDVGDLVSGVFYTSRDAQSDLPAGAIYALEGTGSAQMDRFALEAEAPPAPDDVRIGDTLLRDGVTLQPGEGVTLQWPSSADRSRGDVVVIDVRGAADRLGSASADAVRCAFADEGKAVLPASSLSQRGGAASIAFHRIRRRAFDIGRTAGPGIEMGEVRFDLSVIGRATFAARTP